MKYIYGCWDWLFPSAGTAIHKEGQWLRLMGKRGPKRIQKCILTRKSKVKRGREIEDSRKHGVAKRKGTGESRAQLVRVTNEESCLWI